MPEEKNRLVELGKEQWCKDWKKDPTYEPPSSRFHFKAIIYTLMLLWGIIVLAVWILPLVLYWFGV